MRSIVIKKNMSRSKLKYEKEKSLKSEIKNIKSKLNIRK